MMLTDLETVLARAMAYWYFGYHCDETMFKNAELDTADSLFSTVNGRIFRGFKS